MTNENGGELVRVARRPVQSGDAPVNESHTAETHHFIGELTSRSGRRESAHFK